MKGKTGSKKEEQDVIEHTTTLKYNCARYAVGEQDKWSDGDHGQPHMVENVLFAKYFWMLLSNNCVYTQVHYGFFLSYSVLPDIANCSICNLFLYLRILLQ